MNVKNLFFIISLSIFLIFIGCEGKKGVKPSEGSSLEKEVSKTSPKEIGEAVGKLYVEAIEEVVEGLKDKPEVIEAKKKMEELKESYVQKLIVYGKKHEKMNQDEKNTFNRTVGYGINKVSRTIFKSYLDIQKYYRKKDRELGNLITTFNAITQYANFELLKKQAPKEAERLGIK